MHTWFGTHIEVGGEAPTIRELAQMMSREPRWGGMTLVSWSVLQHVLACMALAQARGMSPSTILAVAFHDSEEALTGDIPSPVKTEAQRAYAQEIRDWLYAKSFKLPKPSAYEWQQAKEIDDELVAAEAHCFCHPASRARFGEPSPTAVDVVWDLADMPRREAVNYFIEIIEGLMELPAVRVLRGRVA